MHAAVRRARARCCLMRRDWSTRGGARRRMSTSMVALDMGAFAFSSKVCLPKGCGETFKKAQLQALYEALCDKYFNTVADPHRCSMAIVDCGGVCVCVRARALSSDDDLGAASAPTIMLGSAASAGSSVRATAIATIVILLAVLIPACFVGRVVYTRVKSRRCERCTKRFISADDSRLCKDCKQS